MRDNELCQLGGFWYPAVVETTFTFSQLKEKLCSQYPWRLADTVDMKYFNFGEERYLPLMSDLDLGMIFSLNAAAHFGRIRIDVVQPSRPVGKGQGKRVKASSGGLASSGGRGSCVSADSANTGRAACRSTAVPSAPSASVSQVARPAVVDEDGEPDEAVPVNDDEDERMFPELVDRQSQQAMEDQYTEELTGARFDDTDDEENEENNDSLVLADFEGDEMPTLEWNRDEPNLQKGALFQTMQDCRNALITYCIKSMNDYEVVKSEPTRFTVKCPYNRCRWRMHASTKMRSTLVLRAKKSK